MSLFFDRFSKCMQYFILNQIAIARFALWVKFAGLHTWRFWLWSSSTVDFSVGFTRVVVAVEQIRVPAFMLVLTNSRVPVRAVYVACTVIWVRHYRQWVLCAKSHGVR